MKQVRHTISKRYLIAILLLLFLSFECAEIAAKSNLTKEERISLDLKDVTLINVFFEIENITEYKFFYKNDDIDLNHRVTIKVKKEPIKTVLSKLFKNTPLDFQIIEHQIILKKSSLDHEINFKIQGKVIDEKTGKSIPYCNITIGNTYTGTSSNEQGDFVIYLESLPDKLIFTHINYQKRIISVNKSSDIVIELSPLIHDLEEVTLRTNGNDNYAKTLASKAFEKIKKSVTPKYGKALYRQTAKNGEQYSEFSEIIFDINYNSSGIKYWEIIEGRYALKKNNINNKNFTLFSRLLKSVQPDTKDLIFPLHSNLENLYKVRILDVIKKEEGKIAVLQFTPLKSVATPIFEGEVYINTVTFDVLKVTGTIFRDDLKLIKLTKKHSSKKNYILTYEMVFKKDSLLGLVLDFIKVDQEFDYYEKKQFQTHLTTTSNLSFFQHYTPIKHIKLGKRFKRNTSDWDKLNKIGYDEEFWKMNPIVKRTPAEKEVIAAFEKDNVFESIFINSRQQIAILQSDLVNDPFIIKLSKTLRDYNNYNAVEKVYLHTDKDLFVSGENLWYSCYTTLGSNHYYSVKSKVLHVDLINSGNKIIVGQEQELKYGRGKGSIEIPKDLPSGTYQLRAYTNWMRNFDDTFFFYKTIHINHQVHERPESTQNSKIDLQFFPEGGNAIVNLKTRIAFKIIGNDGLGKKVKGKIINSKGEKIANLKVLDRGAGFFQLLPKKGESYVAVLDNNSKYPFSKIKDEGYVMSVDNRNSRTIRVKIQASKNLKDKPFYVIGYIRNKKYYQGKFEFRSANLVDFEIPKNRLPSGVMILTLLDQNKKPWCERVLFVNNQEELVIQTKLNTTSFNARDKIMLNILVTDTEGRPIFTNFSIAITDAEKVQKDINETNILTYFLLQSEMKGNIVNPASFFKDQKSTTRSKLDLIMLTHGWRRFNWKKIEQQNVDSLKQYPFYQGLSITGLAKNLRGKPLKNVNLKVIAGYKDKPVKMYTTTTNSNGRFEINNISYGDSIKLVFKAFRKKTPIDVQILLDKKENAKTTLPPPYFNNLKQQQTKEQVKKYKEIAILKQQTDSIFSIKYGKKERIKLDEVVIQAKMVAKRRAATKSNYGVVPDATIYMEDHHTNGNFLYLLGTIAGVRVLGTGDRASVKIRNNYHSPLWVIDGVSFEPTVKDSTISTYVPPVIASLNSFDIERIEVLKGPSAAAYGLRGAGGVIIIYTKTGVSNYMTNVLSPEFTIKGFSGSKEFYSPKYSIKQEKHIVPDYRTTLYWNPSVSTDINGNASITFFNSDTANRIQIVIEGLSIFGVPGTYSKIFEKKY